MAGQNKIQFEVGFNTNTANLQKIETELSRISAKAKLGDQMDKELQKAGETARRLSSILESSFNRDLGTVNIAKFNQGLRDSNLTLSQVKAQLTNMGTSGAVAWNKLSTSIMSTNVQIKEGNKFLNNMATTMGNTLKWGVASSILNTMSSAIREAYSYSKQLDSSLTSIRIVTGDSADEMARFAEQANAAAKNLGANTLDYTKSALSFYQQGLDDEAVASRTEATIKAANVTGARASEVAENLTAVWNGFQAQIGSETDYVDKLAAVADHSASNLAELATAMSKVASVANNMGVDMDQLTAQISTIIATTRQAPETVGNALKTIYARINDIKTGSDEAEISLGNYTGKMASLGINVLDATGHLRDTGDVMEEIGAKWGTMSREQQIYLAQTMAGQRQMNNLVALFDNWTQYSDMLNVSLNAQGALNEKNNRYLESTQAHLNELKSTYQDLFATLINNDELNSGIDTIRNAVQVLDNFLEGFGGGIKSIAAFGAMIAFIFREQIGRALGQAQANQVAFMQNTERTVTLLQNQQLGLNTEVATAGEKARAAALKDELSVITAITDKEQEQLQILQDKIAYYANEEEAQANIVRSKLEEIGLDQNAINAENSITEQVKQRLDAAIEEQIAAENRVQMAEADVEAAIASNEAKRNGLITEEEINQLLADEAVAKEELAIAQERVNALEEQYARDIQAAAQADTAYAAQLQAQGEKGRFQQQHNDIIARVAALDQARMKTQMLTSSIMMLTMAWGSLSSLMRTWTDENASMGDKISQTMMTVGFTLPMLITSYNSLSTAAAKYAGSIAAANLANTKAAASQARMVLSQEQYVLALQKGILQEGTYTITKSGHVVVTDKETAANVRNTLSLHNNIAVIGTEIVTKIKEIATRTINIGLLGVESIAYWQLAAAIGAVVAIAWAITKAYDAQANKAKQATQAAHDAKERATELKDGYYELKNSLDSLKDARSTLNGLKEGTQEWKEAVLELNEQVLALVDKFPELAAYLQNNNGILSFSQGGIDKVLEEQMAKAQAAQNAAINAQVTASKEQGLAEAQQVGRDVGTVLASPEKIYEAAQIYAQHAGEIVTAGDQSAKMFSEMAGISERDAEALLTNTAALLELNATAQGIKNIEQNRADNAFEGNEDFQKSEYQEQIRDEYNKRYEKEYEQRKDQYAGGSAKEGIQYSKNDLANIYQELTGITLSADELKNITKDQLADQLASYQATKALADETDDIIQSVEEAGKNGEFAMNAFEQRGQEALDKFNAPIDDQSQTIADRNEAIDSIGTDRILKGEDNINAIQGALAQSGMEMEDFFTKMPDGTYKLSMAAEDFKKIIDQISLNGLAQQADDLQNKINILESATQANGVAALGDYSNAQHQVDLLTTQGYNVESLGEWQTKIDSNTLTDDDFREIAAAAKEYRDVIPELNNELDDLEQQSKEVGEQMRRMVPRDDEVNLEQLDKLSDYLEDNADKIEGLADGLDEADYDDVAESLLRYKNAVEDIAENYDDWIDAINDGDLMEQAEAIDAVRDNMGDLLDLPFDGLSDDFVTSAENLDLMRRAAEGDEEAYNQLAEAARKDIIANAKMSDEEFQTGFQDLMNKYYEGQNLDDLEVGASLNNQGFLDGLTDMVNAAGMTADQATDYLASMGVDAQVIENNAPTTEQKVVSGWDSELVPETSTGVATILSGMATTAVDLPYQVFSQVSTPHEETITTTQDNKAASLKVTSAKKSSGGGFKRVNAGGGGGKKGGGGGGKGKKGGGGKGKKVEPPKKKDVKKDPYHDVNDQLKESERRLKKLQNEEKKLTGEKYLENLKKQNEELEKQRRLLTKKADIAKQEMKDRLKDMQKEYGNIFSVDEDGYLTNYVQILRDADKQVQEAFKKAQKNPSEENNQKYDYAVERYNKLKSAMEDYTKEVDTFWDQVEADEEARRTEIENKIKAFEYTIDVKLDTADFERDWKEFNKDVLAGIKDDDYANLSLFSQSMAKDSMDDANMLRDRIKLIQADIKKIEGGGTGTYYTDDVNKAYEDLKKYTQELMEKGQDIKDMQEDVHDNWMDAIDAAQDAFDEQVDEFDQINDIIEHNIDMLEMLYGDEVYDQAAALYQQQADNAVKQLQFLQKETNFWKKQMDGAKEGSDAWKEYKKNWEDSVKATNDMVKDSADYFYKVYEATFNKAIKTFKDSLSGGNFDKQRTAWEDYLEDDERYLDSLSRANGTYNLILKTQEAIGNANVKHQKELNKWLNATKENLEGQTELRQIDLDIAEKELDIILKRQALEDAQNNKSKMRLRRDSQGNYRYQFVSDQNAVAQAQQELRDSIEDLRLLVKDDFKDTVSRMYDQIEDFADEAAKIAEKYGYNTKEFNEQMELLQSRYINTTSKTARDLYEMLTKLTQATGVEATELFDQMGDDFQAALGMDSETYKTFEELFRPGGAYVDMIDGFITSIYTGAFDSMSEETKDRFNNLTNLLPSAVADLGQNFAEKIRDAMGTLDEEMSEGQEDYVNNINMIAGTTSQNFENLTTNLDKTKQATENLLANNDKLINSYGKVITQVESTAAAMDKLLESYESANAGTLNSAANQLLTGDDYNFQNGTNGVGFVGFGGMTAESKLYESVDSLAQVIAGIAAYDTGGYTGDFDGGKLAVIHAQEYVLNPTDTINILTAAQITRDMMSKILDGKQGALASIGSNYMARLQDNMDQYRSALEQSVIINADFPAAESAAEIKQAFNELINLASQKASKNRRAY